MKKKNEKGDDEERQEDEEERKESEECLLQHPWCGNFSPQFTCTETYTQTLGLSCSVCRSRLKYAQWPVADGL
jgi:hypothetical protein